MCAIHYCLTSNGYKCIGIGDEVPTDNVKRSDMLPSGWNEGSGNYSIVYDFPNTTNCAFSAFILKIVSFDGLMLVHLLRMSDEKAVAVEIKTSDFTTGNLSSFEDAYKDRDKLEQKIKSELIDSFTERPRDKQTTNKTDSVRVESPAARNPLLVESRRPQQWDPFSIGRSDLDPLGNTVGGGGGGMIFDPMHRMRTPSAGMGGLGGPALPRGAVVPGARFDPFGPPELFPPSRAGNHYFGSPDPDHLPPPGYDDMYM
jgi:proteasome inhibitor subunit 1 (PI31)